MKDNSISSKLYNLIKDDDKNNLCSTIFDCTIILLILLNIVIIISDTFKNIPDSASKIFNYIEIASVVIFTLEYIARIWTAIYIYPKKNPVAARIKYVFTFKSLIDLLSILPFYLPLIFPVRNLVFLRAMRLLRVTRLFKLNRYSDSLTKIKGVLKSKSPQLLCSFSIVIILMLLSSVLMYFIENGNQPDVFENAFPDCGGQLQRLQQ
jgi:voltage-gated potassium channel